MSAGSFETEPKMTQSHPVEKDELLRYSLELQASIHQSNLDLAITQLNKAKRKLKANRFRGILVSNADILIRAALGSSLETMRRESWVILTVLPRELAYCVLAEDSALSEKQADLYRLCGGKDNSSTHYIWSTGELVVLVKDIKQVTTHVVPVEPVNAPTPRYPEKGTGKPQKKKKT